MIENPMITFPLLILFLPLVSFIVLIFFGKKLPRQGDWVAVGFNSDNIYFGCISLRSNVDKL